MTLKSDRLSVVIPTYQGRDFLADALGSVARLAAGDIEVLVVDDGSTDGTVEIARAFESKLPLRILMPRRRGNWMAMTNIGLAEATGARCCILHQDDMWLTDRSAVGPTAVVDCQGAMICMETQIIDRSGRAVGRWRFPRAVRRYVREPAQRALAASLYVQNWLAVPSVVFSTQRARDCGGLDESLWYTADWDLWLKLLHQDPAILVRKAGSAFRVHARSQTLVGSRDVEGFREQMAAVQARHAWALVEQPAGDALRRAGDLSTSTNAALAAAFHVEAGGYSGWLRCLRSAGVAGVHAYLGNASLGDRLLPRARVAASRGRLHR
jgi:hypothetical protein